MSLPEQPELTGQEHWMAEFRKLCQAIPDLESASRALVIKIEEDAIATIQQANTFYLTQTAEIEIHKRDMMLIGIEYFGYPAEAFEAITNSIMVARPPLPKPFKSKGN